MHKANTSPSRRGRTALRAVVVTVAVAGLVFPCQADAASSCTNCATITQGKYYVSNNLRGIGRR